jgi:Sulfotransferase family
MLVHIGHHKTGTTFLQSHIFCNKDKGFFDPWTVDSGEAIEHFVLTHPRRFDPRVVREAFDAARGAGGDGRVPVISHEDLCGYPVYARYYGFEVADRLHATFPEARVLIVIREQRSMLRSLYGQYVKQDGEWPIEMFLGNGAERTGFAPICRLDHLEYDLLAGHYIERFGRDRVLVLPFEELQRDSIRFEQRVHDFAGTGAQADAQLPPRNVGAGAMTLAIMRRLNRLATKRPPMFGTEYKSLPVSFRAKQYACRVLDAVIPGSWHQRADAAIRRYIDQRVAGYYQRSNRALAELTGLDLAGLGYDL